MRSNLSFLPYFRIPLNRFNKINGGADLGNLANHASWNGKITITCGGVASGTKIRIIRICGVNSVATPPNQKHESKMITKVRYSKNPDKTIDYILNPKKGAYVVSARGVSSFTDREHTHRRLQPPVLVAPVTQSEGRTHSDVIPCQ